MGFPYTEEHRLFRQSFHDFLAREITPYMRQWEKERQVPREAWRKLGEQGYLCTWLPEAYGGSGLSFEYEAILIQEMAYQEVDIPVFLHSDIVVPYLWRLGNDEQKHRYLPGTTTGEILTAICMTEPGTGSDLAAVATSARRDGNSYVINGSKIFITNGWDADLFIVVAKTGNDPNPHRNLSLFLVEDGTPGFAKTKKLEKMGRHAEGTAELAFQDVRVPKENLLGEEGRGFYYLMQNLQQERLVAAIGATAEAEIMLQEALTYAKQRKAFGQPIGSFQYNSFRLAEMATEVELGRTFVEDLMLDHIQGNEIVTKVSMAKWWCTEMANRIAAQALQLHGGYGYMEEFPICRQYQNVRVETIFAGTTEIMKSIIAKQLGL